MYIAGDSMAKETGFQFSFVMRSHIYNFGLGHGNLKSDMLLVRSKEYPHVVDSDLKMITGEVCLQSRS